MFHTPRSDAKTTMVGAPTAGRQRRTAGLWLAAVIVTAGVAAPLAQGGDPASASVAGRVADALTGRPIAGVLVDARVPGRTSGREARFGLTDDLGRFVLDGLAPGRVTVHATRPGYLDGGAGQRRPDGRLPSHELIAGQRIDDVSIRLWRAASISGRVTDSTGRPLPAVEVMARRAGWVTPIAVEEFRQRASTDDRGEYEIHGLPPGPYVVFVPVAQLTTAVNARGAMMRDPRPPDDASMFTSEDGRFRMWSRVPVAPQSADGTDAVFVTTGYPGTTDPATFLVIELDAGEARPSIDIVMATAPRVRIRGQALGPDGPLAQVVLYLTRPGLIEDVDPIRSYSHRDGRFEFLSAPPGSYILRAFRQLGEADFIPADPEGLAARMPLTVGTRDIDDLTVRLERGVPVRARVVLDGEPPPDRLSLFLASVESSERYLGTVQQVTGDLFEAAALPLGRYLWTTPARSGWMIASVTRDGRDVTGEPLDVGRRAIGDLVVTMTNRLTSIRGTVSRTDDAPIELSHVIAVPADPETRATFWQSEVFVRTTVVDEHGAFSLAGLLPGRYVVAAVDEAFMDRLPSGDWVEIVAGSGEHVTLVAGQQVTLALQVRR